MKRRMAKVVLRRGLIEGVVILPLLRRIPAGTAWSGTFMVSEGGPKTYRVEWEFGFGPADTTRYASGFRLDRADFPSTADLYPVVLRELEAQLTAACRTSGGKQRFRVTRVEWEP